MIDALTRRPLRWAATGLHGLRRAIWYFRRPRTFGVHAVAVTPAGNLVLVRLRYVRGWRLPGGGRGETEDPRDAVLRELREEIGMRSHGAVEPVSEGAEILDPGQDVESLFIVRDVDYRPGWSLEVEAVTEASLEALPEELSDRTRRWLELVAPLVRAPRQPVPVGSLARDSGKDVPKKSPGHGIRAGADRLGRPGDG